MAKATQAQATGKDKGKGKRVRRKEKGKGKGRGRGRKKKKKKRTGPILRKPTTEGPAKPPAPRRVNPDTGRGPSAVRIKMVIHRVAIRGRARGRGVRGE